MRNFHIKSIILGIGIGIVLTSIISLIYTAGINPVREMTKEEIISKAKELGMVESNSIINIQEDKEQEQKPKEAVPPVQEQKPKEASPPTVQPQKTNEAIKEIVKITVNVGEGPDIISKRLLKLGLIDSKEKFITTIVNMKLQNRIRVGQFEIEKGMSYEEIINIITRRKV